MGDLTGYVVRDEDVPVGEKPSGWVVAKVGLTQTEVRINLDQAYVVEEPQWLPVVSEHEGIMYLTNPSTDPR